MREIRAEKGELCLRLAAGWDEVDACQRLRYQVFYEELGAVPEGNLSEFRRDSDRFDLICDHLVVVRRTLDNSAGAITLGDGELIGTYRLLRQEVADSNGGFYTQAEFDLKPLLAAHPHLRFLELGRSCVLKAFRTKPVVELLWQGIWDYVRAHRLDVMFGCASLEGTDPQQHALALTYLSQLMPPPEWYVRALPDIRAEMRLFEPEKVDQRRALRSLPPLIKGYLRLGCFIGDGAVVDYQFNTIDVLIILPVTAINSRYFAHFGEPTG